MICRIKIFAKKLLKIYYGNNKDEFLKLKKKFLKDNTKVLFDSNIYTKNLEKIYESLVK